MQSRKAFITMTLIKKKAPFDTWIDSGDLLHISPQIHEFQLPSRAQFLPREFTVVFSLDTVLLVCMSAASQSVSWL
jgi:hypothetical protein